MKKAQSALFGAIFAFCACGSLAQSRAPLDPGILEKPPANVDPQMIERPPPNGDPGIVVRPGPPSAGRDRAAAEPDRKGAPPPPVTGGGPDLPSVIVVPHGHAADRRMGKGCWVQFYDEKGFGGRSLTLVGPAEMPKMNIPGGLWVNWSSAVVGPNATVTTFDYEQFRNRSAVLRPGQRISDLKDRNLGLFEDIHSLRVRCSPERRG